MKSWRKLVTKIMGKSDIPTILHFSTLSLSLSISISISISLYHNWQLCEKNTYTCITLLDKFTRMSWKKTDTWIPHFVVFTVMLWKKQKAKSSKKQKKYHIFWCAHNNFVKNTEFWIKPFDMLTIMLSKNKRN